MAKSTNSPRGGKPADNRPKKPYPEYPLFFHRTGRIAKKVRGTLHYFGRWGHVQEGRVVPVEDIAAAAQAAVDLYRMQVDDLQAGRTPRKNAAQGVTLRDLVNAYLTAKRHLLDSGEITSRSFGDYFGSCERAIEWFGKDRLVEDLAPDDFGAFRASLAKTRGTVALGNEIVRQRMIFKFGFDHGMLEKPVRTGQSFEKPSAKTLRKARAEGGQRMFEADELRRILDELKDETVLRAMVLLAVNCGYGQTDIASLPETAVDLDNGWAEFPRPKTGIERRAKLWPETVAALREVLATRPAARDKADAGLVFLTPKGKRWLRVSQSENPKSWSSRSDLIGANFSRLLRRLHINGRRGLGFYTLRHVLETIGGESRDQVAVDPVMGHVDASMAGRYRERISDSRLEAVAETVRAWLSGEGDRA